MKSKIKEFVKSKGYTLYGLANELGLHPQVVYYWGQDRRKPSWDNLDSLCTLLNCTLDDLFEIER